MQNDNDENSTSDTLHKALCSVGISIGDRQIIL